MDCFGVQFLYSSQMNIKIGWNLYEIPNFIVLKHNKKGWRDEIPNFIARYLGKKKSFLLFLDIDTISLNSYLL